MPDLPSFLTSSPPWGKFLKMMEKAVFPPAVAFVLPQELHRPLLKEAGRYWLCNFGMACGECPSCRAWSKDEHPDLIVPSYDREPDVEKCRMMSRDLHLKPVVAKRRVGAVFFGDDLNLSASNSLLKLTEEPPEFSGVFFFMEKDSLIPTLKSRVWPLVFHSRDLYPALEIPAKDEEWLSWLSDAGAMDRKAVTSELRGFQRTLASSGRLKAASGLSQLLYMANKTNLSPSMMADCAFLLIEEDYPFESLFDGFR